MAASANLVVAVTVVTVSAVESALRTLIADLDYDQHKYLERPEDGGPDRYPELAAQLFTDIVNAAQEGR
ncbi:hypothetical protein [Streptomyces sp. NPDC015414]|uniref:hypothetical protein n=1 Tax=Streptomyces sp. NPDC015414 TaxID=3364957 RepID=UPI0036FEC1C0